MESQVLPQSSDTFYLRKILMFNTTSGLTLPKSFCKALGLENSGYVKIFLVPPDKIGIKKFSDPPGEETPNAD